MNRAKRAHSKIHKVRISLNDLEFTAFSEFLEVRGAKADPYGKQLILTVMDPSAGPIVEAAMRGRAAPDLRAGQAREAFEAIATKNEAAE